MQKLTEVGQPCRNCKRPLVKVVPKERNKKKAYWFEWYLKCESCGNMHMVESAKIFNPSYKPKKPKPEPVWKKDWLKNKANKEVLNAEYLRNYQALDKIATAPKYIGAEIMRSIALKALDRDLVCQ